MIRWNEADNFAEVRVSAPKVLAALAEAGLEPARREEDGSAVFLVPRGTLRLKINGVPIQIAGGQEGPEAFLRGEWRPSCGLGPPEGHRGRLTQHEQETFIVWSSAGPAEVETASHPVRQRLEKAGLRPAGTDAWFHAYRVPREAVRLKLRTSVRLAP